jgi:hypothetical protein
MTLPSDIQVRIWLTKTGEDLNGSTLMRSDNNPIRIIVIEPNQTGATLRLVCRRAIDYPFGAPIIIKSGTDFTTSITPQGNTLVSNFSINTTDTIALSDRVVLRYDLEREGTVNDPTTLEQGQFTVIPDIATN